MWATLIVQGGPWALISLCVVSVLRGWLIPRRTYLDRVSDLKATIAALEATVDQKDEQLGILLGVGRKRGP